MTVQKVASSQIAPISNQPVVQKGGANMYSLQELILKIGSLLSELSRESAKKSQKLKEQFHHFSEKAAEHQRGAGTIHNRVTLISFLPTLALPFAAAYSSAPAEFVKSYEAFFAMGSKGLEAYGGTWTADVNASGARASARHGLIQTDLGNEGQKTGDENNLKSQLEQVLSYVREMYKSATR